MSDETTVAEMPETETSMAALVAEAEKPKIRYGFEQEDRGPCEKHIRITVPRDEIDRLHADEFKEIRAEAQIEGFRKGKVPGKLIERRFKKEIGDKVKYKAILETLERIGEDHKLLALEQPDIDYAAITVPETGDFTYEFNVEVAPSFDTPEYKGLPVTRRVRQITDDDVRDAIHASRLRMAPLVEKDGPIALGDTILCDVRFVDGDVVLAEYAEEQMVVAERASLADGIIEKFGEHLVGKTVGDTCEIPVKLGESLMAADYANKEVLAVLVIQKVSAHDLSAFNLGGTEFDSNAEFRDMVKVQLQSRIDAQAENMMREQIRVHFTKTLFFDLPPELLRKHAQRQLRRKIDELKSEETETSQIQAQINYYRQNAMAIAAAGLREQFVLARIAEEEKIEATEDDYEREIMALAAKEDMSVRQARTLIERQSRKEDIMAMITERLTFDRVLSYANVTEELIPRPEPKDENTTALALQVVPDSMIGTMDEAATETSDAADEGSAPKAAE